MEVRVSGHQLDVGAALAGHIESSLATLAEKYSIRSTGANVTLAPGPHDAGFTCDILVQLSHGHVVKAADRTMGNAQAAFDGAADKVDKQLRRYKRRLEDHRSKGTPVAGPDADYRVLRSGDGDHDQVGDHPLVVAETRVDIPDVSVSDAVMILDLRDTGALLFKNSKTGEYNMVYRRGDGHIGWVEPTAATG